MKHLNDILNEGILDVDKNEEGMDDMVDRHQIWKDLTEREIIQDAPLLTFENLDFDSKGRIIFKNYKGTSIRFDLSHFTWPDSVLKRGFGDIKFPIVICRFDILSRGKLSDLKLLGKYEYVTIAGSKLHLDEFPKVKHLKFRECFFRDTHIKAKRKPKGIEIEFNEMSYMTYAMDCMKHSLGCEQPGYAYQKIIVET